MTLNIQVAPQDQVDSSVSERKESSVSERKESVTTRKTSTTTSTEQTTITSVKRRKSVILQCAVTGPQDVQIDWLKEGKEMTTTEQARESRYSIERKASDSKPDETIIQLEICDASVDDKGTYELIATSAEGEKQSQKVSLTEEAIVASLAAQLDEGDGVKKKKKKIVKKKKKKEAKKEVIKPELSSFLKSQVSLHLFAINYSKGVF